MDKNTIWRQERPSWCNHLNCQFVRRAMDALCCGKLLKASGHGKSIAINTHRLCMNPEGTVEGNISPGPHVVTLILNGSDTDYLRWMLDAIDGKSTSWRSQL